MTFDSARNPSALTDINRRHSGIKVTGASDAELGYSLKAKAEDIELSILSNYSTGAIELYDGGRVSLTADNSVTVKAEGTAGHQYAVIAYKGFDQSAVAEINGKTIDLTAKLVLADQTLINGPQGFERDSAYAIRTQGSDTLNFSVRFHSITVNRTGLIITA